MARGAPLAPEVSTIITIPVAMHVVRSDTGEWDVTDQQIVDQIAVLNAAYASIESFQFSLASIDRTNSSKWSNHQIGSHNETAMKNALAISPATTLNFYVCHLGGNLPGYSTFPWSYPEDSNLHGVVCLYASLPGGAAPYNLGDTARTRLAISWYVLTPSRAAAPVTVTSVSDTPRGQPGLPVSHRPRHVWATDPTDHHIMDLYRRPVQCSSSRQVNRRARTSRWRSIDRP
jgi:hypothetical protein